MMHDMNSVRREILLMLMQINFLEDVTQISYSPIVWFTERRKSFLFANRHFHTKKEKRVRQEVKTRFFQQGK